MKVSIKAPLEILLVITLGFMIFFPAIFIPAKIIMIAGIIFVSFLNYSYHEMKISRNVLQWCLFYIVINAIYFIYNIVAKNPDPISRLNVNIIEPIIFTYCILVIDNDMMLRIIGTVKWISLGVLLYNIFYFLSINGIVPYAISNYMPGVYANLGGMSLGYVKFGAESLSWIMFLWPIYLCRFIYRYDTTKSNLLLIMAGLLNAVFSMRSAFLIIVFITPILCILFSSQVSNSINKKRIVITEVAIILIFFILIATNGPLMQGILSKIQLSFSNQSFTNSSGIVDAGGQIRRSQMNDLINTWKYKPIFGWGDTANSLKVVRSDISGGYELTYFALLMQRGLVGVIIFAYQIIWIYINGVRTSKHFQNDFSTRIIPVLVGYTCILLANATNPYLQSFDRLIILFSPLFFINLSELYT